MSELKVYEGTLIPLSWGHKNKITSLGLYTQDGRDIKIICPKKIRKLKKLINHPVKLEGRLQVLSNGDEILQMERSHLLKKLKKKIFRQSDDYEEEFSLSLPNFWEGEMSYA